MQFDEATAIDILILLGEELVNTAVHGIVEKAFRCLGGSLPELIASLDGVYDVLKLQEEDLTDTGFVCASENELIFTSDRIAVAYLLLGSLQNLSKKLYKTECTIQMDPIEGSVQRFRYLFKVEEVEKIQPEFIPRSVSSDPNDLQMANSTFCKMFPWHFIMDENLELLQIGMAFSKLFKNYMNTTKSAQNFFKFRRPVGLKLEFNEIIKRTNTPFLLTLKAPAGRHDFIAKGLEIKGQMVFCPGTRNTLLFVGSPFLDGLEGLTCNGLFLSDIPLYDATREVILVGEQARAQDGLKRRMDKLKKEVEEGHEAVSKERKKNVSLLQLIFPDEIAEKLWLGKQVDAQSFPDVTMLFSDIVGFTSICSSATPFQVISMLESLYKVFDELCGVFDVYKVETIGDAYCVAKGLEGHSPTSKYDAHKVAFMALKMIETCAKHCTHDGKYINVSV